MDTTPILFTNGFSPLMTAGNTGNRSLGSRLKFARWFTSRMVFASVAGIVLFGWTFAATASDKQQLAEDTKKVVFVAGKMSHGYGNHEYRAGCMLLARLLEENTSNIVTKVYTDGWPEDENAFEGADAIIIFSNGGGGHMVIPHLESLNKYMERGVGLGVIHFALEVPAGNAGDYFLRWIGGYYEAHWSVNPFWTPHFENIPEHEVTQGVNPFELLDEWYYHMRFTEHHNNIYPVLSALPPASSLSREDGPHSNNPHVREAVFKRKEPQHLMWLYERTQMPGRGFGLTGGHYHWEWGHPDFRTLTLNAILWVAGAPVPENGVPTPILTLEELEKNQDYDQPEDFNRDKIRKQLEERQAGHTHKTANH